LEDRRQAPSSGSTPRTKLDGSKVFDIDLKLPGMLNAAIKDCPVFGGKLKSYDESKIVGMPGVKKVVRVQDTAVAVVADTWWQAKKGARSAPRFVWDEGMNGSQSSAAIAEMLKEGPQRNRHQWRSAERRRAEGNRGSRDEGLMRSTRRPSSRTPRWR